MKPANLFITIALTYFIVAFVACKKSSTPNDNIETTLELSTDLALAENFTEDANNILMEVTAENGLTGQRPDSPVESMGIAGCASSTIAPLSGFPKTIILDFGIGCSSTNGIARKGKINIVLSDSLRKTGTTAVLTFDSYYVNGYKKDGIITWTNNSTSTSKGWKREVQNGKITAPDGRFWLHNGAHNIIQTAGYITPRNLLDDVFLITGNSSVTNSNGITMTALITDALQKKAICENVSQGSIALKGPANSAVINFGAADCDNIASISVNGGTSKTFFLR